MTKQQTAERDEAIANLQSWIPKGSTVYTILRSVSRSGMQREVSVVIFKDGVDLHPSYSIAKALGRRYSEKSGSNAIVCQGVGMDMGFDLVYALAHTLYGDGYALSHRWL